ncbi:MAG: hypothetical protein SGILL_002906 [Bacillariaceae sp.]
MRSLSLMGRLSCLLFWWTAATMTTTATCNAYMDTTTYSAAGKTMQVRREQYCDHWDSDTLAYYLDNDYPGYDISIMFYAQWDQYSHQLAPYYGRIAEMFKAGSGSSKLIMAFFDCELNQAHQVMCETLGVTAYPTIMFMGSGAFYDTDPITGLLWGKDKSAGVMGHALIPNTVKFQGNWQIPDSILDWIKTMQGLSRYHVWATEGFGQRLRKFFLPRGKKKAPELPVGVPGGRGAMKMSTGGLGGGLGVSGGAAGTAAAGGGGGGATDETVALLQEQLGLYENVTEDLAKSAERASTMIESVLFSGQDYTDMFTLLDQRNAWLNVDKNTAMDDIQRSCVMEISMDYCQRVASQAGNRIVDELEASGKTVEQMSEDIEKIGDDIVSLMSKEEPYCGIIETCIANDMKDQTCRPKTCPFKNEIACRYLTTCTDPAIIEEYRVALGMPEGSAASL